MMNFTIKDFWSRRLDRVVPRSFKPSLAGWSIEPMPNPSFVEAELHLRTGYDDLTAPIWFVAAPGAVGKSTLAKEISAQTNVVYLDLAKADTVAGNYLTGGLVKNDLLASWKDDKSAILIDALDEARLRVTQGSFEDFLNDVVNLSHDRDLPTVFFGRVGIIDEAWLHLSERGLNCPIFDIDFFDPPRARRFVMAALDRFSKKTGYEALAASLAAHKSVYQEAGDNFVAGLESASASDGARFAGYAPVLEAVATVLAGVTNPARLNQTVQAAMQGQILQRLTDQILEREAAKLRDQLRNVVPQAITEQLYSPTEQLARLTSIIIGTPQPSPPAALQPQYMTAYDAAVNGFMPQHPYLDGTGRQPSSAVFAAVISANALFSPSTGTVTAAERYAGHGPHTPNPFLVDFYLDLAKRAQGENPIIPPEHVVVLYESLRARAAVSDIVRLDVDGDEKSEEAEVEIHISGSRAGTYRRITFRTSQAGELRFGRQVNGVSVDSPQLDVRIGSGNPVEMVAPVSLNVARLSFNCPELVILRSDLMTEKQDSAVTLEARQLAESTITSAPLVRKGAELSVSWPGAASYPWSHFAGSSTGENGQEVDDVLRGLRRLVIAFRSHSRGELGRFRDKIEHARMTKGKVGDAIRQRMMKDGILSLRGDMYILDPDALGRVAGTNYQDLKLKHYSERVRQYVLSIVV